MSYEVQDKTETGEEPLGMSGDCSAEQPASESRTLAFLCVLSVPKLPAQAGWTGLRDRSGEWPCPQEGQGSGLRLRQYVA